MNKTNRYTQFLAGITAMMLSHGFAAASEGQDPTKPINAIYLSHPDDRVDETPGIPGVVEELAKAFLTPKLALKHEPVDVFYVPNADCEKFPDKAVKQLLNTYRKRHGWQEGIKLNVHSTILDLKEPSKQIASAEQLEAAVKKNTTFSAYTQFRHLILGDDSNKSDAMVKGIMRACFSEACRHTLVLKVGDGANLQGFLLGAVRTRADDKRDLVGLLVIWD